MTSIFDDLSSFDERTALICNTVHRFSYYELIKAADVFFDEIPPRSLVFLLCTNSYESVIAYVGCLRKRIVPLLLPSSINHELLGSLLEEYRPNYLVCPKSMPRPQATNTIVVSIGEYVSLQTIYCNDNSVLDDSLALLLTTSGSTGSSKLVRLSYENIFENTKSIINYLSINADDRAITTLPMSYTYGLSIINTHLFKGATILLTEKTLVDKEFWSLFVNERATTFGGVPYTYEILKKIHFEKMNLPSLRYITQAGGKMPSKTVAEFAEICKKTGKQIIVMYGQTEATARMSYLPWKEVFNRPDSIGIPIPGGTFVLEDEKGDIIHRAGDAGELVYYGKNVSLGYAVCKGDLAKGDENYGVLHTGDLAKRDDDGYYYIVGRKGRYLKIFGSRVSLDEVEVLLRANGIESACSGRDDKLCVFIENNVSIDHVRRCILGATDINIAGVRIIFIEKIPRNESGKIAYGRLPLPES